MGGVAPRSSSLGGEATPLRGAIASQNSGRPPTIQIPKPNIGHKYQRTSSGQVNFPSMTAEEQKCASECTSSRPKAEHGKERTEGWNKRKRDGKQRNAKKKEKALYFLRVLGEEKQSNSEHNQLRT
jgi:hypothetical protein